MRKIFIILLSLFIWSCESSPLVGKWNAKWEMDSSSFTDTLQNKSFTMNGVWEFNNGEEMSITTYGFKGCIFGEDTLKHSQNWKISNDTIYLLNDEEIASLTCKILSQDDSNIKLQLYSDIYVNLTKE